MHDLSTIDADAHQPLLVGQETAPFGCEQESIGLQTVTYPPATAIIALQPYGIPIEGEWTQQRFTPMPSEEDVGSLLHLDISANKLFEHRRGHVARIMSKKVLLLGIVTILATQVAQGTCRLGHHIERAGIGEDICHDVSE